MVKFLYYGAEASQKDLEDALSVFFKSISNWRMIYSSSPNELKGPFEVILIYRSKEEDLPKLIEKNGKRKCIVIFMPYAYENSLKLERYGGKKKVIRSNYNKLGKEQIKKIIRQLEDLIYD